MLDYLLSVKAAVLDEDLVRLPSRDDAAREIDAGDVGLARFRIRVRFAAFVVDRDTHRFEERVVRSVSGQGKHGIVRNRVALAFLVL